MYKQVIGIVGGFGGFATVNFFRRLLESFNTGYERDYPHIIMDNDFTMPSRTRALLYGEDVEEITHMIGESIRKLIDSGADYIILVCGTAHWFLDEVYKLVPEAKGRVLDIIELTGKWLEKKDVSECMVIAAEGTLKMKLYDNRLEKYGINVFSPSEKDYTTVRYFIENVKKNIVTDVVKGEFTEFLLQKNREMSRSNSFTYVILGCTELSVLTEENNKHNLIFIDPLEIVIDYLKNNLV